MQMYAPGTPNCGRGWKKIDFVSGGIQNKSKLQQTWQRYKQLLRKIHNLARFCPKHKIKIIFGAKTCQIMGLG